ncbi:MAG: ABC transporter permease [Cyclobacteriaceae bacterium]
MKRFRAFVVKEFYHILRDARTLLILIGMPIVQILLFGYAITNEIREAPIKILDHAKDATSREITSKIVETEYFALSGYLKSEADIEAAFHDGTTKMVVVFPQDFGKNYENGIKSEVQLIADATDPNTANSLVNYVEGVLADFNLKANLTSMPFQINAITRMRYNPLLEGVYYFVPGIIAILLMLVSAMMTSISITREKELGTMEVLLASPMSSGQIIIAKVIPYLILSFLDALIILALGKFVFEVPIAGSLALLLGVTLLFIMLALSLGILISTVAQTQQTALLLSLMALMLPTIMLSGFIFPVESMPIPLQIISNIVPARWFIVAVKDIMLKGSGLFIIWKEVLILCGFTLVFIAASIRKFKVRIE